MKDYIDPNDIDSYIQEELNKYIKEAYPDKYKGDDKEELLLPLILLMFGNMLLYNNTQYFEDEIEDINDINKDKINDKIKAVSNYFANFLILKLFNGYIEDNVDIEDKVNTIINNYINRTALNITNTSNSIGRFASLNELGSKKYFYSAILDNKVCGFCRSLDGLIINANSEEGLNMLNKYNPPMHSNCRCMLINISE